MAVQLLEISGESGIRCLIVHERHRSMVGGNAGLGFGVHLVLDADAPNGCETQKDMAVVHNMFVVGSALAFIEET